MPTKTTITTSRKELLKLLAETTPITSTRGSLPVVGGVRLAAFRRKPTIEASNLSVWRTLPVPGTVTGPRATAVVSAKQLRVLLKDVLAEGEVSLELGGTDVCVHSNGTTLRLPTMPAENWIAVPPPALDAEKLELSATDVERIRRIAGAASDDDARPILTGISIADGYAAATDSYRLAVARLSVAPSSPFLFPAAMAPSLPEGGATLIVDRSHELVCWDGAPAIGQEHFRGGLIVGDFPRWEQLIPGRPKAVIVAEREPLLAAARKAVKTAAVMMTANPVSIERLDDTTVTVTLYPADSKPVAMTTTTPARKVYKAWTKIAFNPEFFAEGLELLRGTHVRLEEIEDTRPVMMRDEDDKTDEVRYLLMPVRINA